MREYDTLSFVAAIVSLSLLCLGKNYLLKQTKIDYNNVVFDDNLDRWYHIKREWSSYSTELESPAIQDEKWSNFTREYSKYQDQLYKRGIHRFVTYKTTESGLANKINGLVSSLLIAMITNRGFMFIEWVSFDSYFTIPLKHHMFDSSLTMDYGRLLLMWRRCVESDVLKKGDISKHYGEGNIEVYTNCPLYLSVVKNDDYYKEFVRIGLVRQAKKGEYKLIGEEVYYRLLNYIGIRKSIRKQVAAITAQWDNRYSIGMQIRVGQGSGAKYVDFTRFLYEEDINLFIHYASYYTNETNNKKPIWFISTDSPRVYELFLTRFPSYSYFVPNFTAEHSASKAYIEDDPDVQRAIVDNYLLSECKLVITTNWSTFGEMAVGRMKKGSHIVITRGDTIVHPPPVISFNRG